MGDRFFPSNFTPLLGPLTSCVVFFLHTHCFPQDIALNLIYYVLFTPTNLFSIKPLFLSTSSVCLFMRSFKPNILHIISI